METLPKKWHVIPRNEEQDKIFSNWRGGTHGGELHEVALTSDKMWNWLRNVDSDSVEITFYQFKKLVLEEANVTKLPEKWYIRGSEELSEFFNNKAIGWLGNASGSGYYTNFKSERWQALSLITDDVSSYTEISLDDFFKLSNPNRQEQTTNQTTQNLEAMNTTAQPKDKINAYINNENEIVVTKNGSTTLQVAIAKETITTRVVKLQSVSFDRKDKAKENPIVTTVEREVSISVIADKKGDIHTGYSVKNPTDKNVLDEIGKTIARNRAVNPKTNLTLGEGVTTTLISKQVLKGVADLIFAQMSQGSIKLKGVK